MAAELLAELRSRGVLLSIDVDGRLAFDAPAGALGDDLIQRMRAQRDELMILVERFEERAAIVEHDGGLSRDESEAVAWEAIATPRFVSPMIGYICPWCRSGSHLIEHDGGLRCGHCDREAWRFDDDGAIVRCDWIERIEVDVGLIVSQPIPEVKVVARIDAGEQLQPNLIT
ncbi:hypothetical protein CA13_05180 [Planctomycetes bacterium CA13]|uniref:TubC N-terminal docking domain-containing protein n=1 Tax=Novipirellula herctigrandis TaxID=2527986 RepID=A0A5C5YW91_9BACT|nr:hypothetical protein CA13_05180 [Planctomycetes bacterium CA13]